MMTAKERAGVKFADSDLIGLPYRVVIGRGIKEGVVEVKARDGESTVDVSIDEVVSYIQKSY
jgi:prolyl-tRNA synthetase